jgi:hypothetical protein
MDIFYVGFCQMATIFDVHSRFPQGGIRMNLRKEEVAEPASILTERIDAAIVPVQSAPPGAAVPSRGEQQP